MLLRNMWIAAVAIQAFAAFLFLRRDLVRHLPVVWCSFLYFTGRSVALLMAPTSSQYTHIYALTGPLALLFSALSAVEVFHAVTRRYRSFSRFGQVVLGAIALASAAASAATKWFGVDPSVHHPEVLLERYGTAFLVLILAGSWVVIRVIGYPPPPAASRTAGVLTLQACAGLAVTCLMTMGHATFAVRVAWPITAGLITAGLWCLIPRWTEAELPSSPRPETVPVGILQRKVRLELLRDSVATVREATH